MGHRKKLRRGLSRRELLKYGLYGGLAGSLSGSLWLGGCGNRRRRKKPNIVMLLVDTLRADHMSLYGYHRCAQTSTTPNIERLAEQGVVFERVIAPSTWTKTSMASIMTSTNGPQHGVFGIKDVLPARLTTLAKELADKGYHTIGVNTNPWLKPMFGFKTGFHIYQTIGVSGEYFSTAQDVNRTALDLLKDGPRESPIFLYLHYMDVHAPYTPRPPFFSAPPVTIPGLGAVPDEKLVSMYRRERLDAPGVVERMIDLYDGEIRTIDADIDQLIEQLQKMDWFDNTILVITSDHGEAFREHGTEEHGKNLYPEVYEVPLILVWPGCLPAGLRIGAQVRSIDITPTLLALAGLAVPQSFDGKSLLPMKADAFQDRIAISAVGLNDNIPNLSYVAVVSRQYLYIREKNNNVVEFYDLHADPGAHHNLGASHPKAAFYAGFEGGTVDKTTEQTELDPQTRQQLESLGYLR